MGTYWTRLPRRRDCLPGLLFRSQAPPPSQGESWNQEEGEPTRFPKARATNLSKILTEAQMKEYFGWTQDSKMAARYVHLSGRDVDGAILRAHGLRPKMEEEAPKLTVVTCVRCGLQNSTVNKFCSRCSMPLHLKTVLEMKENLSKQSDEEIQKMRDELDELRFAVKLLQDASGYRVEPLKQRNQT